MLVVTSQTLQPVDFSDSAIGLMDGNVMNRYKFVTAFYMSKYTAPKTLSISGNTITNTNPLDYESFLALTIDGLPIMPGEKFKIQNSTLNTGVLTVASATATTITTTTSLTTETIGLSNSIYITSAVTAFDYYYNLIGNNEPLSFVSKTDAGIYQKYTISGIAAGTLTPTYFNIGTKSLGWVTDILSGSPAIVSTSTITGAGISGVGPTYKQAFTITHYFTQTPLFLPNTGFPNPPAWYQSASNTGTVTNGGLQYVAYLGAKYNATDTTAQNVAVIQNNNGTGSWYNQNSAGTVPDFTLTSIAYVDNATSNILPAIDFTKTNNVTIVIASASGAFTSGTILDLAHFYCPLNPADYQGTSTTLLQNFMNDRIAFQVGTAPVNGLFYGIYGGNYSVIQGASAVLNSANKITITFKAIYAAALQTYLIARPNNRNYGFSVATE